MRWGARNSPRSLGFHKRSSPVLCSRCRPRTRQNQRLRAIASRSQKGRDAVRPLEAHLASRPIASAGSERRPVRIHPRGNSTKPAAARQAGRTAAAGKACGVSCVSVALRASCSCSVVGVSPVRHGRRSGRASGNQGLDQASKSRRDGPSLLDVRLLQQH